MTVTCKIPCSSSLAAPLAARTALSAAASESKDIFTDIFSLPYYSLFPPDLMDTGAEQSGAAPSVGAGL